MHVVLVGHYAPGYELAYYFDWRDAFAALPPQHQVRVVNTHRRRVPARVFAELPLGLSFPARELRRIYRGELPCDVLVFAPSFFYFNRSRRQRFFEALAAAARPRFCTVFFMENEFRLFEEKLAYAQALGANVIVSQLPADVAQAFYGRRFAGRVVSCPAAVNPAVFRSTRLIRDRSIHVGTRSHRYPSGLGDDDRNRSLDYFQRAEGPLRGLTIDVSTDPASRLSREGWAEFLGSCKTTISTEAGAASIRWQGDDSSFCGKAISSRHFEAMGTKTVQVLLPGRYNDILEPDVHYVPLEADFSNIESVAGLLRDDVRLQEIADRASAHALSAHTYAHRVQYLMASL